MGGKDGLGGSVMVSRRSLKRTCLISDNEAGARLELEEGFLGGGLVRVCAESGWWIYYLVGLPGCWWVFV